MTKLTPEMADLLEAFCLGELTPDEATRLEYSVSADNELCEHYIRFMYMHALAERLQSADVEQDSPSSAPPCSATTVFADAFALNPTVSVFGAPSESASSFLFSGWPLAYLLATVIVGVGLLIAGAWKLPAPEPIATRSTPGRSPLAPDSSLSTCFVGRITGMVDCQWSDRQTEAFNGASVPLGRKYALSSGLMQITYDAGAKVLLEGPCTYEVESATGGYLSLGKLTARVEKNGNGQYRMMNDELRTADDGLHPSSFILHPLFAVRTPTAIVTDLGTEFGVEVDDNGTTHTHVFEGKIAMASIGNSAGAKTAVLVAGQSAESDSRQVRIVDEESGGNKYLRTIHSPTIRKGLRVIAHFRLGEDDVGATAGEQAQEFSVDHTQRIRLQRHGSPRYTGDVVAPGSTLAVQFDAGQQQYFACRYILTAETANVGIEAWVKPNNSNTNGAIAWNGDTGWGLLQRGHSLCAHLNGFGDFGAVLFTPAQWHHIALVREQEKAVFYVNGVPHGVEFAEPCLPTGGFRIGSTLDVENNGVPGFFFDGAIDEVRIFEFTPGEFRVEELLIGQAEQSQPSP